MAVGSISWAYGTFWEMSFSSYLKKKAHFAGEQLSKSGFFKWNFGISEILSEM